MTDQAPPRAAVVLLRRAVGVAEAAEGILGDLTWPDEVAHAVRSLRRSPAFTLLSVTILALGIGSATAFSSAFRAVALDELPISDPGRIVALSLQRDGGARVGLTPDEIAAVRREARMLRAVAGVTGGTGSMPLTEEGRPLVLDFAFVTAEFFDVLGARPALGRLFRPEDGAEGATPVAVISHRTWQHVFGGDRDLVGRRLTATQYQGTYSIVGVAPAGLDYPVGVDYWILPGPRRQALSLVARLAPEVTPETARSELLSIATAIDGERTSPAAPAAAHAQLLSDAVLGETGPILLAVAAAGGILLLIACANVGNLLLMRAARRARATMVRRALGATSGRIARLFLLEAALLGAVGGALGLVCALGLLRLLPALVSTQIPRSEMIALAGPPVGVAVAVTASAVVLVGLLSALPALRGDPASRLRGAGRWASTTRGAGSVRRSLVASQVALAVVVLFAAGLLVRTLQHLSGMQLGYETEGVVLMELGIDRRGVAGPAEVAAMLEGVFERVRSLPGVTSVTPLMSRPFIGDGAILQTTPVLEGQTEAEADTNPRVPLESGGSELFRTLGVPILRGRGLLETDREDAPKVAVVSESLADRLWPGEDPVGARVRMSLPREEWWTIVGVAGETRFRRLLEATPTIYLPWRQFQILPMAWTLAARIEGDPATVVPAVSGAIRTLDPRIYLWQAGTMVDHLRDGPLAAPRTSAMLFASFGLAALLLAAVGLYGVMALAVQERTRDLGVRRALGARSATIRRDVLRDAAGMTAVGGAVGLGIALASSRMLAGLLYDVPPHDVVTVGAVGLVLAAVSLLAAYLPARRATRVDPVVALRAE